MLVGTQLSASQTGKPLGMGGKNSRAHRASRGPGSFTMYMQSLTYRTGPFLAFMHSRKGSARSLLFAQDAEALYTRPVGIGGPQDEEHSSLLRLACSEELLRSEDPRLASDSSWCLTSMDW